MEMVKICRSSAMCSALFKFADLQHQWPVPSQIWSVSVLLLWVAYVCYLPLAGDEDGEEVGAAYLGASSGDLHPSTTSAAKDVVEVDGDGYSVYSKKGRREAMEGCHSVNDIQGNPKKGHGVATFNSRTLNLNLCFLYLHLYFLFMLFF